MNTRRLSLVLALAVSASSANAQSLVPQSVVASGGGLGTSANFTVHGTVGQPIVGTSANAVQQAFHGYWLRSSISTVDVGNGSAHPRDFGLAPAFPNPAQPRTTIVFALPREAHVQLRVFDAAGAQVAVLADGPMPAGWHRVSLDTGRLASGVYFYRLVAPGFRQARRLVVVR